MPARKMRSIRKSRRKAYESIKSSLKGVTGKRRKAIAAAIANKGATPAGRRAMARKAARTRKRRRRKGRG